MPEGYLARYYVIASLQKALTEAHGNADEIIADLICEDDPNDNLIRLLNIMASNNIRFNYGVTLK